MQFINGQHFNNLRGNIYGGLTAAVVALPLAMGVASGVGPVTGMDGAIFAGFFAALFASLEDIINDTINAERHIFLIGACDAVRKMLDQQKIRRKVNAENIYKKRIDALLHAQRLLNAPAVVAENS